MQLRVVSYQSGAYIVVEGKENADHFFIIQKGNVRISKEVEVVDEGSGLLGPGDFFGVVSTMSSHSHIETAQALSDVSLITVRREQFSQLIEKKSQVAMKIILEFSKRLRYLDTAHTRLSLQHAAEEDASHLFTIAEYYFGHGQYEAAFYAYSRYLKIFPAGENAAAAREQGAKAEVHAKGVKTEFAPNETSRAYPKGTMLFAEGEPGQELFIIQKGSVKIVKIMNNNEVLLALLKAGDIFGEMALLESKPRAASAVAYEDCQVLAVNHANFKQMITAQPQLITRLTTLLAERIWLIYKQLANTLINNPLGRMFDALHIQLEKNNVPLDSPVPYAYTFEFGPKELANMVGLPLADAKFVMEKMLENNRIMLEDDKIRTTSVAEIIKQASYYKKMDRIEKMRMNSKEQGASSK